MGQLTIELRGKPVLVAKAEWDMDPAEIVFVDRDALPGVEIKEGLSLDLVIARISNFASDIKEKMVRKVEGVIHPVYAPR